jgi:cbb3-type cytochrome oxidase maturation protein
VLVILVPLALGLGLVGLLGFLWSLRSGQYDDLAVLWRKRHKPSRSDMPRWGHVMKTVLVAAYLCASAGAASAGLLPSLSGLPCLIQATVRETGLCPIVINTPSRTTLKPSLAASSGVARVYPYLWTGASPTTGWQREFGASKPR